MRKSKSRPTAEAARCLALLERDLPQAEALALEAKARAPGVGVETVAIPMLWECCAFIRVSGTTRRASSKRLRELALRQGDRTGGLRAIEHLAVLELERNRPETAALLCVVSSNCPQSFVKAVNRLSLDAFVFSQRRRPEE